MAIREIVRNGKKAGYDVQVSLRHPKTRKKKFLRGKADTKWDAQQLEAKLKLKLKEIIDGNVMPTWDDFVAEYERDCLINKAASTSHNELSIIASHASPVLRSKLISEITENEIRTILQNVDPDKSLSLKHNIRKVIANVFNHAIERRIIVENPCKRVKLEKMAEPKLNILNDAEIRLFLKNAEQTGAEWFPIWAFGIYTGMRSGELIALKYKHLQYNEGKAVVKIQESWTKQGGYKPYTKNKKLRTVPINSQLQRIIDQLRKSNPDKCGPEDFVLPQIAAWRQGDASKELRAFLRGCNLPVIRFHDLRSCFISQSLIKGISSLIVMNMVGHSSMKTLMRYSRITGSDLLGQTDVLNFS